MDSLVKFTYEDYEIKLNKLNDLVSIHFVDTQTYKIYYHEYTETDIYNICTSLDIFYTICKTSFEALCDTGDSKKAIVKFIVNKNCLNIDIEHKYYVSYIFNLKLELDSNTKISGQDICIKKLELELKETKKLMEKQKDEFKNELNKIMSILDGCQIFAQNIYNNAGHVCNLEANNGAASNNTKLVNISIKELDVDNGDRTVYRNIKSFYQLEKFTIGSSFTKTNLKDFENRTLKELILYCNNSTFTSLTGIENFPNLEILSVQAAPALKDIVTVLSTTKHKLKTIKLAGCSAVNSIELQTYCQKNNIFLAIS